MKKADVTMWSKWTHKKYGITMEVTKIRDGWVTMWDRPMSFKWTGMISSLARNWDYRDTGTW
jgi:hypothetical protein